MAGPSSILPLKPELTVQNSVTLGDLPIMHGMPSNRQLTSKPY